VAAYLHPMSCWLVPADAALFMSSFISDSICGDKVYPAELNAFLA
jgi:hypothetical protein